MKVAAVLLDYDRVGSQNFQWCLLDAQQWLKINNVCPEIPLDVPTSAVYHPAEHWPHSGWASWVDSQTSLQLAGPSFSKSRFSVSHLEPESSL